MENLNTNVVIKVGNDYVSQITPTNLVVTRKQSEKLIFPNKELALAFENVLKYFTDSPINIISEVEDKENNSVLGTFENAIAKANSLKLARAREIIERNLVLGLSKSFSSNKIIYTSKVRSQNAYNCYYTVTIECNKKKEILKATCECPDFNKEETTNCKHVLATILYIQEWD